MDVQNAGSYTSRQTRNCVLLTQGHVCGLLLKTFDLTKKDRFELKNAMRPKADSDEIKTSFPTARAVVEDVRTLFNAKDSAFMETLAIVQHLMAAHSVSPQAHPALSG